MVLTMLKKSWTILRFTLVLVFAAMYYFLSAKSFQLTEENVCKKYMRTQQEASIVPTLPEKDLCQYQKMKGKGIFYHRVHKTASETVYNVLRIFNENKERPLLQEISNNSKVISTYRNWLHTAKTENCIFYNGYISFIDFEELGLPMPLFITTFRDPVDRALSMYYYLRFLGLYGLNWDGVSFEECIVRKKPDCFYGLPRQVIYFCGNYDYCTENPQQALEKAKQNIAKHYLVVGPTKELMAFFQLLEQLMPQVFTGVVETYTERNSSVPHQDNISKNDPRYKRPSERCIHILKTQYLADDYHLDRFLWQTFYGLKEQVKRLPCLQEQ